MIAVSVQFDEETIPTVSGTNEINVTVSFPRVTISPGSGIINLILTGASFTGSNYQNDNLIGLVPDTEFFLYSNDGSGVLLKIDDGYTFNDTTGTITTTAGNYRLQIFL